MSFPLLRECLTFLESDFDQEGGTWGLVALLGRERNAFNI